MPRAWIGSPPSEFSWGLMPSINLITFPGVPMLGPSPLTPTVHGPSGGALGYWVLARGRFPILLRDPTPGGSPLESVNEPVYQ